MKNFLKNISPFNCRREMPIGQYVVKKILAFWLCYIGGMAAAEGAVIALHFALGKNVFAGEMFDGPTIALITYYGFAVIAGVALLYWRVVEKKPLADMGLTRGFAGYGIGALAGVILPAISVAAIVLTGNMEYLGWFDHPDYPMILLLFGGFAVQGAAEEILCRGIAFHALKERTPIWLAAGVSTILFILPHMPTLMEGDPVFGAIGIGNLVLISMIFTLLTIRYRSIWPACGLHSVWNAMLYCVFGLNVSGGDQGAAALFRFQSAAQTIWNGGAYGIEASLITAMVLALGAALLYWQVSRNQPKKNPAVMSR